MKRIRAAIQGTKFSHKTISWIILGGLLFLRLLVAGGETALLSNHSWIYPVYQIGTYLLTALLIYWERNRLIDFHIDKLALFIIIIFKPLQTLILYGWHIKNPLTFPNWPSLIVWIIAIILAVFLWKFHNILPKLTLRSFIWLGIGIAIGLVASILFAYPMSLQTHWVQPLTRNVIFEGFRNTPITFLYQLGFAAVSEEPLFRGFLWGYLLKAGWKGVWIWLFQAGLFMLGHIYYIGKLPISFWILVPVSALVFGALVWRSKTISSSLAAHATMNTFGIVFANVVTFLAK